MERSRPDAVDDDLLIADKDLLKTACEDLALEMPAGKSCDGHNMPSARKLLRRIADFLLNLSEDKVSRKELVLPHLPLLESLAKRCFATVQDKLESLALYRVLVKAGEKEDVHRMFFRDANEAESANQNFLACLSKGLVNKSTLEELMHEVLMFCYVTPL